MEATSTRIFVLSLCCIVLQLSPSIPLFSQSISREVVATSGDHFAGPGAELEWTLGEVAIETYAMGSTQLTQGFHQTYLIISELPSSDFTNELKIFPNPTTAKITLQWSNLLQTPVQVVLCDVHGKTLQEQNFRSGISAGSLSLDAYTSGIYFLRVNHSQTHSVNTYKIQKIR